MAMTSTTYLTPVYGGIETWQIDGGGDAVSLSNGGAAFVGDNGEQSSINYIAADGTIQTAYTTTWRACAVAELDTGNIVVITDQGTDLGYSMTDPWGGGAGFGTIGETGDVSNADVAGLAGGGFAIVYQKGFSVTDHDVKFQVRSNDGTLLKSGSLDFTTANDQGASVAALTDGGFAVAWHRNVSGATEIWYAVFNGDGTVRRAAAELDGLGTINRNASIIGLADGGFAIAYEDNGWSGADTDISLARLDAAGAVQAMTNVSDNDVDDTLPSVTEMSNGMIVVGSTQAKEGGGTDAGYSLVDPVTGKQIHNQNLFYDGNETGTSVAAMSDGRVAVWHASDVSGEIKANMLFIQRVSDGESEKEVFTGDDAQDVVNGHGGNDVISGMGGDDRINGGFGADNLFGGAGNDRFDFGNGAVGIGEKIAGGVGADAIELDSNVTFVNANFSSIERLQFSSNAQKGITATLRSDQLGGGLHSKLVIADGWAATVNFLMLNDQHLDLSNLAFEGFVTTGAEADRIRIIGDDDSETMIGSKQRDEIIAGGGADTLAGGGGTDKLQGGFGDDVYLVDAAGEAIEEFGQGNDTVRADVDYALGANIERLVLVGIDDLSGVGNGLANVLLGNAGDNFLNGGGGKDVINGGEGVDRFTFNTALGPTNVDKIVDFEGGVDKIRLDDAIFTGLTEAGKAGAFHVGPGAAAADDRIIYNPETGALFFDVDGKGGAAQVKFATIDPELTLAATDFIII